MTVLDFPACRPLIELQAAAKLLLYSANSGASTSDRNKNEPLFTPPSVACIGKSRSLPPSAPQVPGSEGGFLGSVSRMNAPARLFHPITRTKLFGWPRPSLSKEVWTKRPRSSGGCHIFQTLLSIPTSFMLSSFGSSYDDVTLYVFLAGLSCSVPKSKQAKNSTRRSHTFIKNFMKQQLLSARSRCLFCYSNGEGLLRKKKHPASFFCI